MDNVARELFNIVVRFSKRYGVDPPQTNDIRDWWLNTLQQMAEEDVCMLYETGLLKDGPTRLVKIMRVDLKNRYYEIRNEKATLREQDDLGKIIG